MGKQKEGRCPKCGHDEFAGEYLYARERGYLVFCVSCKAAVGVMPDYDEIAKEVAKHVGN